MHSKFFDTIDPVLKRLRKLSDERPDLKDAARIYETILPLLGAADLRIVPVSITPDEARSKLEAGIPLLTGIDLELDVQSVCDLILGLSSSLEAIYETQHACKSDMADFSKNTCSDNDALRSGAARSIRLALEENKTAVDALLAHITAGDHVLFESAARDLQLDPGLLWTLAQNALKPALQAWRRQLAPLGEGTFWEKGYCFICGADATLGELRGNGQVLYLRCSQCGADWQFRRLRCIWCGNEDHGTLSSLYSKDQREKMHVEVCDRCHCYLKVITTFSPTPPEMLQVEDLATLHFDYIAREQGYLRSRKRYD
jgi:formate dehydrogenase accessory protein FdhE